jgi:hypothetical protein
MNKYRNVGNGENESNENNQWQYHGAAGAEKRSTAIWWLINISEMWRKVINVSTSRLSMA